MNARLSKAELLAALNEKLVLAKAYDAERLIQHRADCKATATKRRELLRSMIKMSDTALAETSLWQKLRNLDIESCPMSETKRIAQAIKWAQMDNRTSRLIDSNKGDSQSLARILEWEPERLDMTVCA